MRPTAAIASSIVYSEVAPAGALAVACRATVLFVARNGCQDAQPPSPPPPHREAANPRGLARAAAGHRNRLSTSAANAPRTAVDRRPELQKSPGRQPTSRRSAPLRGSAKVAQLGRYARFLTHSLPPAVDETTCEEKRLSRNTPVWTRPQWSVSLSAVDETTCEEKRLSRNTPVWTRPQWSVSLFISFKG
jgi:hypothetical protein